MNFAPASPGESETSCTLWLASVERRCCSNEAEMRKPLKLAGVPKINKMISAASRPKFTRLQGHVEEILLLNKFFSDCRYVPYLRRYTPTKLCDGAQMAIFCILHFSASREQYISDLHCKFALGPHHVWKFGRHPIYDG